jgi:hypothetical protein
MKVIAYKLINKHNNTTINTTKMVAIERIFLATFNNIQKNNIE